MVHISRYFIWFEEARFEIARQVNVANEVVLNLSSDKEDGKEYLFFTVISIESKYHSPIGPMRRVIVKTKLHQPKFGRLEFTHRVYDKLTGKLYAEALVHVAIVSNVKGMLLHLSKEIKEKIEHYFNSETT